MDMPRESKPTKNISAECFICLKKIERNKCIECQFCEKFGCNECVYKTFPFPKNNPDMTKWGKICKVCETKFYIKTVKYLKDKVTDL